MPGANRAASFFQNAASLLDQLQGSGAQQGQLGRIWQTVNPWVTRLLANAPAKWLPILSHDAPCQIQSPNPEGVGWIPCAQPAISLCDCCGKPTCLHHGRIDSSGGVICFPCVAVAHQAVRGSRKGPSAQPPPKSAVMTREEALHVLELSSDATPEQIKKAYKVHSKRYHPDQVTGDTVRFQQVQTAWGVLKTEK